MSQSYTVTSAGVSAHDDRQRRMRVYFIMMSIRMASVASLLFLRGWWILIAIIGGVFLPYVAVVIANAPDYRRQNRPDAVEPVAIEAAVVEECEQPAPTVIVVDEPAERRSQHTDHADSLITQASIASDDTSEGQESS